MTPPRPSAISPDAPSCIDVAAAFLAVQPTAVERALAKHRRREDGMCTGCGPTLVRWPCATAFSARLAGDLTPAECRALLDE